MNRAFRVELMKFRRSPVVFATTALILLFVPFLCRGFVLVAEIGGVGATAAKVQAMVVGDGWEAYLGLLGQMIAVTMFIGPGVVAAWVFGREHADHTFSSLFALPTSRGSIALAKIAVLLVWTTALSGLLLLASVLVGLATNVGPLGDVDFAAYATRLILASLLTSMLSVTIGYVASVGRGYLPAIGAIILLTAAAQMAVLFGGGGWFPYATPGLYAVAATGQVDDVSWVQLLLVPVTTGVIAWLTVRWWENAEAT